jgi:hypothetical protein
MESIGGVDFLWADLPANYITGSPSRNICTVFAISLTISERDIAVPVNAIYYLMYLFGKGSNAIYQII